MIGYLRGRLVRKEPPHLLVDVNGIGYEVEAPLSTCFGLPEPGATVELCTHLLIREDQHTLFGFSTESERRLFRDLIRVSGVGAKTALGVLSGLSPGDLVRCIENNDVAALVRLPGIGRKTAERLIIDLRDRLALNPLTAGAQSASVPAAGAAGTPAGEAMNALLALGYKPAEARRMLERVDGAAGLSTEELLRSVLRGAAPRS